MKQLFEIFLTGLLLVLFNTTATGGNVPVRVQEADMKSSFISQKDNCNQIYDFYRIYPITTNEIITVGDSHLSYPKGYICLYHSIKKFREPSAAFLLNSYKEHYSVHPFPVEYYIFALKKIVI